MTERPDKLNNQAIILASDGDYFSAIACFKRAITIEQTNYRLWANLGITYRDAGDLKNARNALEKAYALSQENEEVLETLATVCLQQKDYTQAFSFCLEGIDLNSTNCHFWNLMGVIFFQQNAFDDAAEHFEMAVTINPYYEDALFNLKDTYDMLHNSKGKNECEKRLKDLK